MLEKLKEIIVNYVDVEEDQITVDSLFIQELGFNSYDFMTMLGEIEDEFDIEVDEHEVVKIKSVQDAIDYISSLQA